MRKIKLLAAGCIICLFYGGQANAVDLNITVSGGTGSGSLALSNSFTLGNSTPVCTMIFGLQKVDFVTKTVNTNNGSAQWALTMINDPMNASEVCVGQFSNYKIYKTSVDGIGISYNDNTSNSQSKGQPVAYGQLLKTSVRSGNAIVVPFTVDVRLWKYSSAADTLPYGTLTIQGPKVAQVIQAPALLTLKSCGGLDSRTVGSTQVCYVSKYRADFENAAYSSTCEFIEAAKTVQMGNHNIPAYAATGYGASWVDASFRMRCPNAYGTYQDPANMATLTQNKGVTIRIVPRTEVIDTDKGIFGLDGTGAKGVGIQLAWGNYASQSSGVPASPVKLNTATDASTISNNVSAGPYAQGTNPLSGDGTINMAARYVRTTGTLQPGPAKAVVEIFANYQ